MSIDPPVNFDSHVLSAAHGELMTESWLSWRRHIKAKPARHSIFIRNDAKPAAFTQAPHDKSQKI